MDYSPENQKKYFQFAYQTGSDIWTHIPYYSKALSFLPELEKDSLVLDIGGGRGLWALHLLEQGYRVLGIDYIPSIVDKVNERIRGEGLTERARFVVGDAKEIPFVDEGFDLVTDIGTMQHIEAKDWDRYVQEVYRVLKKDGFYLNVSYSRKTDQFLGWKPKNSATGDFNKFGVYYHFFTEDEIKEIFGKKFEITKQDFQIYESKSDPEDKIVLVFSIMKKKQP